MIKPNWSYLLFAAALAAAVVTGHRATATISSTTNQTVTSVGNGSTTNFTIGFAFQANSNLQVYLQDESATPYTRTLLVYGVGSSKYTISGGDPGTTIVMGTAPSSTQRLIIKRVTPKTQTVAYQEGSAFPAKDHEKAMDKMTMELQEMGSSVDQRIGLSTTSTASVPIFPDPAANRFVAYDASSILGTFPAAGTSITTGDVLRYDGTTWSLFNLPSGTSTVAADLAAHIADVSNPHSVTAAQVGNSTAQWNANKIQGTTVDATGIANGKVLQYDSGTGHLVYAPAPLSPTLNDAHIFVGDGSNSATDVAISGDATIDDTGVVTIANSAITNAKVSGAAAIAYSKLSLSGSVTNSDHANMATHTIKGNATGGSAAPSDLTGTQVTALLDDFVGDSGSGGTKGLVPAPASGDAAAAKFLKADGSWVTPPGSGQGGINYLTSVSSTTNSDIETSVGSWAAYADAAGASPVDGTGGSPTLTVTRTTSSPLRGVGSLLLTKDAANRQGEGGSVAFAIDSSDALFPQMQKVSFDYSGSANFHFGSDPVTDISDAVVYIYDVTAGVLLQPTPFILDGSGHFSAEFQPTYNSTSYRLILHTATTNASAWTFKVDNISVGPGTKTRGVPVTDWVSYTPTLTAGFGTPTGVVFKYRRVGDTLYGEGTFTTGTVAASYGGIGLPSGLSIDTSKSTTGNQIFKVGTITREYAGPSAVFNGTNSVTGALSFNNTRLGEVLVSYQVLTGGFDGSNVSSFIGSGEQMHVEFHVPIQGWSSNLAMSSDNSGRIIATKVYLSGNFSGTTNSVIPFDSVVFDKTGAFNTSTGEFTCQEPATYRVGGLISLTFGQSGLFELYKNGAPLADGPSANYLGSEETTTHFANANTQFDCKTGDKFTVVNDTNGTTVLASNTYIIFEKVGGSQQVAASEGVRAKYTLTGSQLSTSGSAVTVKFDTKKFDSHGRMDPTTGIYTVYDPGKYRINATMATPSSGSGSVALVSYKGVTASQTARMACNTAVQSVVLIDEIDAVAGDTLSVQYTQNAGTYDLSSAGADANWIVIERVGN